jgi:hypothetical protein
VQQSAEKVLSEDKPNFTKYARGNGLHSSLIFLGKAVVTKQCQAVVTKQCQSVVTKQLKATVTK